MEALKKDFQEDNESELSQAFEVLDKVQAIIEFNLDGTIIKANDNFLSALGYTFEEIQNKHHRIFCDEEYASTLVYKQFWEKLSAGNFDTGEYKRLRKDGKEIWINASYNPVFNSCGKPYKVIKFATDITATKVKNSEYEGKINAMSRSQAVIEFNLDGSILTANQNFLQTLGYTLEELKGKHHRIFCESSYASSSAYALFWDKLAKGEFESGRFKRIDRNGINVWIMASYNPIFDTNGKPYKVVKFATNITEQVEKEESIQNMSKDFAKSANGLKEVTEKANNLARGAVALGATTEEMNASVEELTASINSIAQNTKSADSVAKATFTEAEIGSKAIIKAIEAMELISKSSEDISEIAAQTNLLAFNAAIEAARAGEHGLGFSVVADEVRKLAERSSQATKEISKLINESSKRVSQGSDISKQAGSAFEKIVAGVNKTTQSISEISNATEEQLLTARQVSSAIQQVADETEKSAIASEEISTATKSLYVEIEELNKTIEKLSV